MGFNLDNYETVKQRKTRLRKDYPDSVIFPIELSDSSQSFNYVLMGALIWKDKKTMQSLAPETLAQISELAKSATPQNVGIIMASIGIMAQADGIGHSLSIAGGPKADRNAWVENAEESAVGRALDNMGYHSGSASREEMEKVSHIEEAKKTRHELESKINQLIMDLTQRGFQMSYLQQICYQATRPFQMFSELSQQDLEVLIDTLSTYLDNHKAS